MLVHVLNSLVFVLPCVMAEDRINPPFSHPHDFVLPEASKYPAIALVNPQAHTQFHIANPCGFCLAWDSTFQKPNVLPIQSIFSLITLFLVKASSHCDSLVFCPSVKGRVFARPVKRLCFLALADYSSQRRVLCPLLLKRSVVGGSIVFKPGY